MLKTQTNNNKKYFYSLFLLFVLFASLFSSLVVMGASVWSAFVPQRASAVSKIWDGGCGANTNWSCAANWSDDLVPAAGDTITFNATSSNNSTVDALFNPTETIVTININTGYTGTVTLATTLHVTTSFVQNGALSSFSAAGQTLDMNGSFTLSAGTFTASSGSTTLAGAMAISGTPIFNHNSGNFVFDGATTRILSCGNVVFNLATLGFTSGNQTINSNCSLPLGANPISTGGSIILDGTLTGSGTLTTASTFTLGATYVLTGFSGLIANSLTINSGALADFGSYTTFDINGAFSLNGTASFTAPSGIATFAIAFTLASTATFNANGGTITFDGAAGTIACGNKTFNAVNITHTGNNIKTINSNCNLPLGNNPTVGGAGDADITLNGTLTGTGTLTIGTASTSNLLTISSTSAFSGFTGLTAGSIVGTAPVVDFSSYSSFVVNGAYTQTGGTITVPNGADFNSSFSLGAAASGSVFNAPAGTMTLSGGTVTILNGNTFNANGGTVVFDAAAGHTITCSAATIFNLVQITSTSGTTTVSSGCNLPLGNNPTIGVGGNADITLNGTLTGTGTLTIGTAVAGNNFIINSTGVLTGFSGLNAGNLVVTGATLDFSSYSSFVVNGAYSQTGGSVTMPTAGATFFSFFAVNAGSTFTASSSTTTYYSNFTFNSGATFNANGGTVNFRGGTLSCGNVVFNLAAIISVSGTITVNSDCTLPLGNNPTLGSTSSPDFTISGTLSGTGTLTIAAATSANLLTLNSTAALSGFSGLNAGAITAVGATLDASAYNTFTLTGAYVQTGGSVILPTAGATLLAATINTGSTFTASSGTTNVAGTLNIAAGATFNHNNGTINLTGSGSLICNGAVLYLVTITYGGTGTRTIASGCNVPLGNNPSATASVNLSGTMSGTGLLTTAGTLTLNSGSGLSGISGLNTNNLTVDAAIVNLGAYNTLDVNGNFTLQNNATFTATSANMTVGGNFAVGTGSTFNPNNGTVILDGGDQAITGANTFNNLSKTIATASTLTFPAGVTQTVLGTLTLKGGSAAELLSLVSSDPGLTQWGINAQGTRDMRYLNVTDSNNVNATSMTAYDSLDGGNNTGWQFLAFPQPVTPASDVVVEELVSPYFTYTQPADSDVLLEAIPEPQKSDLEEARLAASSVTLLSLIFVLSMLLLLLLIIHNPPRKAYKALSANSPVKT